MDDSAIIVIIQGNHEQWRKKTQTLSKRKEPEKQNKKSLFY